MITCFRNFDEIRDNWKKGEEIMCENNLSMETTRSVLGKNHRSLPRGVLMGAR